jgi:tetratricopeptide (TPR) repeat protein
MQGRATGEAGPGLAALLRPDLGTIPFTGRADELGELRAWRASAQERAVRVLYGEPGVGKTRLALEIAAEHRADGGAWRLVPAGQETGVVEATRAASAAPLLFIVEHVETRDELDQLLRAVLKDPGPIRVLLMARALGEWRDQLMGASDPAMSKLLSETEPLRLAAPVSEDASDADLAEAAVPYLARALSVDVPERVTVEPADRRVPVLVIHAATLLALLRFSAYWATSLRVVIDDHVLEDLLEFEVAHWNRAASAAGLPAGVALVKRVLAASSLLGATSVAEAAEVTARVPGLAECPNEERVRWARWLERVCPPGPDGQLGALQPDMLAETHVVSQLAADSRLAQSCLQGLPGDQAERALAVLARACEHQDRARRLIAVALRDDLAGLALPAARVVLQNPGDLGDLLADALDDAPASGEVLTDIGPVGEEIVSPGPPISSARPTHVRELRSSPADVAAAAATDSATPTADSVTPAAAPPSPIGAQGTPAAVPANATPSSDPRTADGETTTASTGRAHATSPTVPVAAPATSPAVTPATPARPADRRTTEQDTTFTRRAPAASRTAPAAAPAKPGRPDERDRGADTSQSAWKPARRRRTGSQADRSLPHPGSPRSAASAASAPAKPANRAAQPPEPTRPEDPATGYLEAVAAYRELAGTNPGKYRADLARALTNLGLWRSELGRPDEALQAGQEALTILRELDEADPHGFEFRVELTNCLVSLGIWYSELGRTDEALKVEQEAVSIRRELVAIDPVRYRPDLAASLANLGITLSELGRPAIALGPVREAMTIYRDLARTDPRRYRPDLARCLAHLGIRYAGLNRPAEALPPCEEAVTIRRELARINPDRHRPDLARSLVNLGFRYSELGRAADAVPPGREAVSIYRQLAVASPDYRRELARALSGVAAALDVLGRDAEAERAEGEAAEIMQDLEQSAPAVLG